MNTKRFKDKPEVALYLVRLTLFEKMDGMQYKKDIISVDNYVWDEDNQMYRENEIFLAKDYKKDRVTISSFYSNRTATYPIEEHPSKEDLDIIYSRLKTELITSLEIEKQQYVERFDQMIKALC